MQVWEKSFIYVDKEERKNVSEVYLFYSETTTTTNQKYFWEIMDKLSLSKNQKLRMNSSSKIQFSAECFSFSEFLYITAYGGKFFKVF